MSLSMSPSLSNPLRHVPCSLYRAYAFSGDTFILAVYAEIDVVIFAAVAHLFW